MKKVISTFLAVWMLSIGVLSAATKEVKVVSETNVFEISANLKDEFSELNSLESQIMNEGFSEFASLETKNPELYASLIEIDVTSKNSITSTNGFSMDDMDWGSFAWGLLCCPIGFFVVVTNKNKSQDQKASFWIGWGVGVAINLIYGVATGFEGYGYSSSNP